HERHEINYFYFADANFFGPPEADEYGKERARRLAELIIRNGLKIGFGIECRANDVEEKTFSALVHAGLKQVFLGIESGSQTSLNRFRKGVSVEVNKRAIQTIRKFGIEPSLGFIMFEPYSTLTDIRANLDFLKEMNLLSTPSVTVHLLHHKETLFQGTPDYTQIFNGQGNPAPTGYEATYTFKDERVAKLFNLATHICQKALTRMWNAECEVRSEKTPFNSAIRNPQSVFENQSLIDSFESALGGLRDLENRDEIKSWTKGTS
ncbi:MAG TPA: radical SAM protein, partial [Candidatus Brocadiales bacterium]|nr:radical SAM protein [Candidatus Brocadiales bacterium]